MDGLGAYQSSSMPNNNCSLRMLATHIHTSIYYARMYISKTSHAHIHHTHNYTYTAHKQGMSHVKKLWTSYCCSCGWPDSTPPPSPGTADTSLRHRTFTSDKPATDKPHLGEKDMGAVPTISDRTMTLVKDVKTQHS